MDKKTEVFPRNDLPGTSKAWGRVVEDRIRNEEKTTSNLGTQVNNSLRAIGGQLDTQAALLEELLKGRSTTSVELDEIQVTATTPGVFPAVTRSFQLAPPYKGSRVATFNLSADVTSTTPSASSSITLWFELLRDGETIWRKPNTIIVGIAPSAPANWGDAGFSDMFSLVVPEGATNYSIRIYSHTFVAGTVGAAINNLTTTIIYGDRA